MKGKRNDYDTQHSLYYNKGSFTDTDTHTRAYAHTHTHAYMRTCVYGGACYCEASVHLFSKYTCMWGSGG